MPQSGRQKRQCAKATAKAASKILFEEAKRNDAARRMQTLFRARLPKGASLQLKNLTVNDCESFNVLNCNPFVLEHLHLSDVPNLEKIPSNMPNLKILTIDGAGKLKTLGNVVAPNLISCSLRRCPNLEKLPASKNMPNCQTMHMFQCPKLRS